ncbi:hypothetical protein GY654_07800 [Vibrio parahaemolyticus]|nr:hypothetical protein [Vibrio parahaemolyticus]
MKQIKIYLDGNEYDNMIEFLLFESDKFKNKGDDEFLIISDVLAEWAFKLSKGVKNNNIKELIEKYRMNLGNKKEIENKIEENDIKFEERIKSLNDFFMWFDNNVIQANIKKKYPRTFSLYSKKRDRRHSIRKLFNMMLDGQEIDFDSFFSLMIEQLDDFKNLRREPILNEKDYNFYSLCVKRGMYLDYIEKERKIEIMKKNISEIQILNDDYYELISKLKEVNERLNNENRLFHIGDNCFEYMLEELDKLGVKYS